jgi:mannose-6-phosphate isomerase-like protein (cupin superfamily)
MSSEATLTDTGRTADSNHIWNHKVAAAILVALLTLPAGGASEPATPDLMKDAVRPLNSIHFAPDDDVKCLLSAPETGDPATGPSTFILKAPPGCVVAWHYHSAQEQAIVVSGRVRMEMEAHSAVTLAAGGFAVMQSRTAHQFSCVGSAACLLVVAFDRRYDIFWIKKR